MNSLKLDSDIRLRQIPSVSECINKESDKIEAAVCRLIRTAYTVTKSHMPISMYAELCELQLCYDTCLTKNLYQEDSVCTEFITLISQSLDDSLIEKLRHLTHYLYFANGVLDPMEIVKEGITKLI